ncbi:hypothetical protein D9B85_15425, partial [Corynebacterium diphtheriae]
SIVSTYAELNISNPVPPQLLNVYTSATVDSITVRVASKNGSIVSTYAELNISNPVPPQLLNVYTSATVDSITV